MDASAYLTKYNGLLCGGCALDTSKLVDDGRRWLLGLTAIPTSELWDGACCEECKRPLALVVAP